VTDFRTIECNACGHSLHHRLTTVDDYQIVRCKKCSLVFVNPMPFFTTDGFDTVSDDFYYTTDQKDFSVEKLQHANTSFTAQANEWQAFLPSSKTRALLDIGCGTGLFVKAATKQGWHAEGCDIDATLIKLGADALGVTLTHNDFLDCNYPREAFDVVLFRYVLEHLPNPLDVLKEAVRVLKPGGLVQIVVPNEAGLFNTMNLLAGRKKKTRWGTLTPPHHLHAYTPKTLDCLLGRAGLAVQSIKTASPYQFPYALYQGKRGAPAFTNSLFSFAATMGCGSALVACGQKQVASNAVRQAA
jgi:2-polyprenyl-3-methyl-5-hydroxy-6-metoxy-1,4-benzoquinol methylase